MKRLTPAYMVPVNQVNITPCDTPFTYIVISPVSMSSAFQITSPSEYATQYGIPLPFSFIHILKYDHPLASGPQNGAVNGAVALATALIVFKATTVFSQYHLPEDLPMLDLTEAQPS